MENKCDTPRVTVVKKVLAYFDDHPKQAAMLMFSLSLGFILFVSTVCYVLVVQSDKGCLPPFTKHFITTNATEIIANI